MIKTLIYKFKKRELADTPPDITATEDNWDIVEKELVQLSQEKIVTNIPYALNGGLTFRAISDSPGEYSDTMASIRMMINVNDADIFNWSFVWCTLPLELRPKHQLSDVVVNSSLGLMTITILPNGAVLRGNYVPPTKPIWIFGYVPMYGRNLQR